MPKELLRIDHPITWLRTIIRRRTFGVETEFHFSDDGNMLSVAIGRMVTPDFLNEIMETDCLKILEHFKQQRSWTEDDGFEICINYDDDIAYATTRGPFVRYGPIELPTDTENAGYQADAPKSPTSRQLMVNLLRRLGYPERYLLGRNWLQNTFVLVGSPNQGCSRKIHIRRTMRPMERNYS